MTFGIKLALQGNLREFMAKEFAIYEGAVTRGIKRHADALKGDLRRDVNRAFGAKGARVARAWRSRVYPVTGNSAGSASIVYSKAPRIIRNFEEGTVIRGKRRRYLAIPTANAPKLGSNRKKITPANFPEARFGKLRFVPSKSGGFLVADKLKAFTSKKTGRTSIRRQTPRSRFKGGPVVMFILVKAVKPRKRLNVARTAERRLPYLVDQISDAYNRGVAPIRGRL